jgi:D-threo-aldose 1-dehydrogenase
MGAHLSNLNLGRLGFGAANLGNLHRAMSGQEARDILDTAWDLGIRYFDTAPHYGLGLSERRLGAFLQTKPRDRFVISTKVGRLLRPNPDGVGRLDVDNDFVVHADQKRVWDPSREGIRASLAESLERLGLDRVDVLYLHDPERYDLERGVKEAIPALAELREEGRVDRVGIGSMDTGALLAGARTGLIDLLMVAGRYTLVDQSVVPDVIDACLENSIGIVTAAVFNSGLLANPTPAPDARYDYGEPPADVRQQVESIVDVCAEFGIELPAAALQYTLRDPVVRNVVVGASDPGQLRQSAQRMAHDIPEQFWNRLVEDGLVPR